MTCVQAAADTPLSGPLLGAPGPIAVWSEGLRLELPWLARRMGLIA